MHYRKNGSSRIGLCKHVITVRYLLKHRKLFPGSSISTFLLFRPQSDTQEGREQILATSWHDTWFTGFQVTGFDFDIVSGIWPTEIASRGRPNFSHFFNTILVYEVTKFDFKGDFQIWPHITVRRRGKRTGRRFEWFLWNSIYVFKIANSNVEKEFL